MKTMFGCRCDSAQDVIVNISAAQANGVVIRLSCENQGCIVLSNRADGVPSRCGMQHFISRPIKRKPLR